MRIDKYLKVSRIIKRRTVAQQACEAGRIMIGVKTAKPGDQVKIGDVITVNLGKAPARYEVTALNEHVSKDDAVTLFKQLEAETDADGRWV